MLITTIIFFVAIITAFGMLAFRAWELSNSKANYGESNKVVIPHLPFRHLEKNMLYLAKHIVQSLVLAIVKHWFIFITKAKKWLSNRWPKVHNYFKKKAIANEEAKSPSFVKRAILESKSKIKRIKEKIKKEHGEESKKIE